MVSSRSIARRRSRHLRITPTDCITRNEALAAGKIVWPGLSDPRRAAGLRPHRAADQSKRGRSQPGLRAVFYVNDAVKNGHFVRFNVFSHILLATGGLAAKDSLPRSC
jgi:hypothetical protein